MQHTFQQETLRHQNVITLATNNAKNNIDDYGNEKQVHIKSIVTKAIQNMQERSDMFTTDLTVTRDNAVMSMSNKTEQACIHIQLKAQEVQQDTSNKQQRDQALSEANK
jgi:hypothetical protein